MLLLPKQVREQTVMISSNKINMKKVIDRKARAYWICTQARRRQAGRACVCNSIPAPKTTGMRGQGKKSHRRHKPARRLCARLLAGSRLTACSHSRNASARRPRSMSAAARLPRHAVLSGHSTTAQSYCRSASP